MGFSLYDFKESFHPRFNLLAVPHSIVSFNFQHRQTNGLKSPVNFDGFNLIVMAVLQSIVNYAVNIELFSQLGDAVDASVVGCKACAGNFAVFLHNSPKQLMQAVAFWFNEISEIARANAALARANAPTTLLPFAL